MAVVTTLRFDTSDATRGLHALDRAGSKAVRRALRRTAQNVRTVMVRAVRQDIGLPAATVRNEIKLAIDEATESATVSVSGRRIPLIDFGARGPEPSRGRGAGVSYKIGAQGRKRIRQAFIATMRSGHRGVYARTASSRLPIAEKFGPSLPLVFEKYLPLGAARAQEQMAKNLERELAYALSQKG